MQWFDPTHTVCYVTLACPLSRQDLTVEVWVVVTVKAVSFPDTNLSFHSLSIPGERTENGSSAQASVAWSWEGSMGPRHLLCPVWLLPRADVCRALKLHLG